jgi:hypothetical protein
MGDATVVQGNGVLAMLTDTGACTSGSTCIWYTNVD